MKKYKFAVIVFTTMILSGCASFSSDPHPGKLERVGVLLVKDCQNQASCDAYSLLQPDLHTRRVALEGNIDASLRGRLIAVLGKQMPAKDGMESINVEQSKAITQFDYLPFIRQAVADYVQQNYQCVSLWDQSYAWRLDDRLPVLIATLINPFEENSGMLHLEYDGLSKTLLSAESTPDNANPCRLR